MTALDYTLLPMDQLLYSTFLGGSSDDNGAAIAVGGGGDLYVAGDPFSTNFPTVNAAQPAPGGQKDAFVAKKTSPKFTVVNVIPIKLSGETNQDSEPSIAVNPVQALDSRTVAITTFSRVNGERLDFGLGAAWGQDGIAPVWVSTNNGRGWNVRGRIPRPAAGAVALASRLSVADSPCFSWFLLSDAHF